MNSIGLVAAFLCGDVVGLMLIGAYPGGLGSEYGIALLALALVASLAGMLAIGDSTRAVWTALLVAFVLAGCGRALLIHPPVTASDLAYYNASANSPVEAGRATVSGVISAEPLLAGRTQTLRISAGSIKLKGQRGTIPVVGDMYVLVARYPDYSIGESITLAGRLSSPPNSPGFDYAAYLARQGVFSYMAFPKVVSLSPIADTGLAGYIIAARDAARVTLRSAVAEPEASIAIGVVTGDRTSMSAAVKGDFQTSGTTHILAISGENIALLIGMVIMLYGWGETRQRMPVWLAAIVIVSLMDYTLFTGASASVVRAAIMAVVLLLGPIVGRRYDPVAAMAVSAGIMVLFDPDVLADAGFQLSFGAMLGIACISPHIQKLFTHARLPALVSVPLSVSLGATAATLPLGALLFGWIYPVGPIATLTADLALGPLMVSGIVTSVVGMFGMQAAIIPGLLVWLFSGWLLGSAHFWSSLTWTRIDASSLSIPHALVYYGTLAATVVMISNRRAQIRLRQVVAARGLALLGAAAIVVWAIAMVMVIS